MEFNKAVNLVLKWEGGYVNHPQDPGGETKYGITKRSYPHKDIKNLSLDDAKRIYYRDYWIANGIHLLPGSVKFPVFDSCVNQGPGFAVKRLQKVLRVSQDGVLGPITAKAAQDFTDKRKLVYEFMDERLEHYLSLRTFSTFGKGWLRRVIDVCIHNEYH